MTASFLVHPPTWDRSDWLEWRRDGIGGSDVAALAGLSPFGSPTSVYYDKTLGLEEPENELMRWGRVLEPVIASEFTVETDLHIVVPQALVWDVEHPWRRCTLDGLVVESMAEWGDGEIPPLEVVLGTNQSKTTSDSSWRTGIPPYIEAQCQWEMGVAELDRCWLSVLHLSGFDRHFAIYELEFDRPAFAALCRISDRFWEKHVLAENPPRPDSHQATTDALKDAYRERADGSTRELASPHRAVEWLQAKAAVDGAKQWLGRIENELRAQLGEATFGAFDGTELVTWKPQRQAGRIDEKALRRDHPEIWSQYRAPDGVTRVLRATKALKARVDDDIVDIAIVEEEVGQ